MSSRKISLYLGNIIEHYDIALFGFLSPLLGQIFFPESAPLSQLLNTFLLFYFSLFAKPLGGWIFGKIADKKGFIYAFSYALVGMGLSSLLIACVPPFSHGGNLSILLIFVARCIQSFFAGAESATSGLAAVEKEEEDRDRASAFYGATSTLGIILASLATALLYQFTDPMQHWRLLYIAGGATAFIGFALRGSEEPPKITESEKQKAPLIVIFAVIAATGFSYCTYSFAFIILRAVLPMTSTVSAGQISWVLTCVLCLDALLLLFFGMFAKRLGREKMMTYSALIGPVLCYLASPLIYGNSLSLFLYAALVVVVGTCFCAPYYSWLYEILPSRKRGEVSAVAKALGAKLIGGPAAAVTIGLYQLSPTPLALCSYLIFAGVLSALLSKAASRASAKTLYSPSTPA